MQMYNVKRKKINSTEMSVSVIHIFTQTFCSNYNGMWVQLNLCTCYTVLLLLPSSSTSSSPLFCRCRKINVFFCLVVATRFYMYILHIQSLNMFYTFTLQKFTWTAHTLCISFVFMYPKPADIIKIKRNSAQNRQAHTTT